MMMITTCYNHVFWLPYGLDIDILFLLNSNARGFAIILKPDIHEVLS